MAGTSLFYKPNPYPYSALKGAVRALLGGGGMELQDPKAGP